VGVRVVIAEKVFRNRCIDIIRSTVEYRSSMFIETVFEATFSFPNVLFTSASVYKVYSLPSSESISMELSQSGGLWHRPVDFIFILRCIYL